MKRALILLAVTMLTANSVGCCCCRGLRDWFYQGSYCGAVAPAPTYAAAPPYVAPQYAAPACAPQQYAAPQYAMPQPYAVAPQSAMVYSEPSCSGSYATEMGCSTSYMAEPGCCYSDGVMSSPSSPVYVTPTPAPAE